MSKDDESVVLPKAVRDQISKADEIYKSVYEEAPENPKPEESSDTITEKPANEPASESAEPAADPENKRPEPAPEPANEPAQEDTFEQKYRVLKGKYDKEVPRLHRHVRDLNQENSRLNDRLGRLEGEIQRLNETPEKKEPALSQEEIEQFGPDLIDIIRRVAKEETGVVLDKNLKQVPEKKVDDPDTGVSESARRQMLIDLAKEVPDWETQNEDDDFLAWLDKTDPMSGRVRMEMLAEAYQKADGERLIAIFTGFQKENAVVNPEDEPSDETPDDETPSEENPEQPLEDLVAPGTPKTGSAGAQNESGKKIWNQTEIEEFYAYKNEFIKKNPEKDLPDKVVALERDLFKAQSEGRIR